MDSGFTVWFTGLPGAGKTTLARALERELRRRGRRVELLDGDAVRTHLSKGLGFSREDRDANVRRIGYVAHLLSRNGVVAICAAVSPYREARAANRALIDDYVEVYVRCPLKVLVERDPRGMYARAMAGEIVNFTGVSDPYEEPDDAEIAVDTDRLSEAQGLAVVLRRLEELEYVRPDPIEREALRER